MSTQTITAKLTKKAGNGKGFLLEGYENWFNASEKVMPFLAKIEIGKVVEISYFTKGVSSIVTLIKEVSKETKTETPKPEEKTNKPKCTVCKKDLKDDKYPTCWECKDKAPKEKETTPEEPRKERTYSGSGYGSAEDVAGKEVGCAANCASSILAGRQEDPDTLLEMFRILFNGVLEHIRANK